MFSRGVIGFRSKIEWNKTGKIRQVLRAHNIPKRSFFHRRSSVTLFTCIHSSYIFFLYAVNDDDGNNNSNNNNNIEYEKPSRRPDARRRNSRTRSYPIRAKAAPRGGRNIIKPRKPWRARSRPWKRPWWTWKTTDSPCYDLSNHYTNDIACVRWSQACARSRPNRGKPPSSRRFPVVFFVFIFLFYLFIYLFFVIFSICCHIERCRGISVSYLDRTYWSIIIFPRNSD